jgi:hypothetical protein
VLLIGGIDGSGPGADDEGRGVLLIGGVAGFGPDGVDGLSLLRLCWYNASSAFINSSDSDGPPSGSNRTPPTLRASW